MSKKWQNALVVIFLALSVALIIWLTILSRLGSASRHFYMPFSSYKAVINGSGKAIFEIIGNIILFFPIGVMLSLIFNLDIKRSLVLGFTLSLVIESCQWFFWLGTFEIDDIFHNTIGAGLGSYLINRSAWGLKLKSGNRKVRLISFICITILITSFIVGCFGLKRYEMKRLAAFNDLEDGTKNLLVLNPDFSYIGNTNISVTCNSDGSIFIEGDSENRAWIHIGTMRLKPGKYVLTGLSNLDENTIALILDAYDQREGVYHRITQEVGSVNESEFELNEEMVVRALISIYPGSSYSVTARPAVYEL